MHTRKQSFLAVIALAAATWLAPRAAAEFPLKEGDVWVMAGDSITDQHLHANYFEAFCFARYPGLKFAFRNSGSPGYSISSTLAKFGYDIAAWKPTVVSVELGMNDARGNTRAESFVDGMGRLVGQIRGVNARPVIFSASPVNNGDTLTKLTSNTNASKQGINNTSLHEYALALKDYAAKEGIPYADQFHALLDIWGANRARENVVNALDSLKQVAGNDALVGVEHLRAFLAAQDKQPVSAVPMLGDDVHPGPPGSLMMAASLLKALGADGFVSSVTLDAAGKAVNAKGCQVDGVKAEGGTLSFDRLDERLPFPIPDDARVIFDFYPVVAELSQYTLQVTGLKPGAYVLKIGGVVAARVEAQALGAGVNLTAFGPEPQAKKEVSPIVAQNRAILDAVVAKEAVVQNWRILSRKAHSADAAPELMSQLADLTRKVEEADAKIREAARPQKLHFEVAPAM